MESILCFLQKIKSLRFLILDFDNNHIQWSTNPESQGYFGEKKKETLSDL